VKDNRPVNLDLLSMKYPPAAVVSILHRISGLVVFLLIPFMLWLLQLSLSSSAQFDVLKNFVALPIPKLMIWVFLAGLLYHLVAGIRHLLMDAHMFDDLRGGRRTAIVTMVLGLILIILAGIWLW
jgi:succinate dehydrogenase / fumarate reductase, cytochrome b subunit